MGLLASRLGIEDEFLGKSASFLLRALARPILEKGAGYDALTSGALFRPGVSPVAFRDRTFFTPSRKFEFVTEFPAVEAESTDFPLHLLTPKSGASHNSQFQENAGREPLVVYVHPRRAETEGLRGGDEVWVVGKPGRVRCVLAIDSNVRADVAVIYQGGWLKHGRNVNVLIEDCTTSDGLGPAYYDARVRLEMV
jgi:anaerobic selenocysteine-containing dehydrogenase